MSIVGSDSLVKVSRIYGKAEATVKVYVRDTRLIGNLFLE